MSLKDLFQIKKVLAPISNEQIAEEIGCKPGDVWYKIKKGREMLKRLSQNGKLF